MPLTRVRWRKLSLWIFPILLVFFITITKKSFPDRHTSFAFANAEIISHAALRDTLPEECVLAMKAVEKNGVIIRHPDGTSTAYYQYDAAQDRVLFEIGKLPFVKSNVVSDFTCNAVQNGEPFVDASTLSSEEKIALQFLDNINTDQFVAFECRKYPAKHTLLLDTRSRRILHKVETING